MAQAIITVATVIDLDSVPVGGVISEEDAREMFRVAACGEDSFGVVSVEVIDD